MIYLDRNENNRYTVRIHNTILKDKTIELAGKELHLLLKNTVTNDVYRPVFEATVYEPYFQGTFTQNIVDGEYEYTLYYILDENIIQYLDSGLLNIGKISENKTVDTANGDIVYNG